MDLTRVYLLVVYICTAMTIEPIVDLPYGKILGLVSQTTQNKTFFAFKKIPYAASPVGKLRFQPPQPPQRWDGTLNCTYLDVSCHQSNSSEEQSENCLYLNVFTPELPNKNQERSFPVMFYIHGGGFVDGSSSLYHPDKFIEKEVILVTFNYRLGPFGFLSLQDTTIPGNNGLKDQHAALKWVHDHITLFGGDPHRVTIFGHSAGSASVGYHLLNPKSEGLFWAAICQSGSVLGPWAYQREAKEAALKLVSFINESFAGNSEDVLELLQTVEVEDINRAANLYRNYRFGDRSEDVASLEGRYWAPTMEVGHKEAFITESMYELMEKGKFVRVPLLTGFTTEENLNFHLELEELEKTMKNYDQNIVDLVPVDLEVSNRTEVAQIIKNMYTKGASFSEHLGDGVRFSSDNDMVRPIMRQAELISTFSKTYFYVFSYKTKTGFMNVSYDGAGKVSHGEELLYIFCLPTFCTENDESDDLITQERLVKIWTDFAKFRNPTPEPSALLGNVSWPLLVVDVDKFPYVDIGDVLQVENFPKKEVYLKWKSLFEQYGSKNLISY